MATIRDVARYAGVSTATVSRYLNQNGYISVTATEKIEKAIKELKYSPSAVARSLSTQTSNLIGLLVPDLENPYFPELAKGIEDKLKYHGFNVLLGSVANEKEFLGFLESFNQNNVMGIISSVGMIPKTDSTIPIVEVDRVSQGSKYFVVSKDFDGGKKIAEVVNTTKNVNRIVLISGPKDIVNSISRTNGFYAGISSNKAEVIEINSASFGIDNVDHVIEELFSIRPFPDTIVAPNDLYALVILQKLFERNISIPNQVQLIGYDGINLLDFVYPRIATIRQQIFKLGQETASLLVNIVNGEKKEQHLYLDVEISLGDTLRSN